MGWKITDHTAVSGGRKTCFSSLWSLQASELSHSDCPAFFFQQGQCTAGRQLWRWVKTGVSEDSVSYALSLSSVQEWVMLEMCLSLSRVCANMWVCKKLYTNTLRGCFQHQSFLWTAGLWLDHCGFTRLLRMIGINTVFILSWLCCSLICRGGCG